MLGNSRLLKVENGEISFATEKGLPKFATAKFPFPLIKGESKEGMSIENMRRWHPPVANLTTPEGEISEWVIQLKTVFACLVCSAGATGKGAGMVSYDPVAKAVILEIRLAAGTTGNGLLTPNLTFIGE